VNISKLDAARRQLETAITLYFHEGDPVSIHTLTGAAYEVLQHLNRAKGGEPMIKDSLKDRVKPQFVRDISRKLNEAQNFFKHADKDPDEVLTAFTSGQTEYLLLDACWAYCRLTGERLPVLNVFEKWASVTFAKNAVMYDPKDDLQLPKKLGTLRRHEFFTQLLPVAYAVSVGRPPTP
jgi:hypothetical protein